MIALLVGIVAGYFIAAVWPELSKDIPGFKTRPHYRRPTHRKSTVTGIKPKPKPAPVRVREQSEVPVVIVPPPSQENEAAEAWEPGVRMVIEEFVPVAPPREESRPEPRVEPRPLLKAVPSVPSDFAAPWVAVVLDDWGYNRNAVNWLARLEGPVTLAVLPGLEYSRSIPREAHRLGHEVILHMPMEPKKGKVEEGALKPSMSGEEIRSRLNEAINSIPYAVGVNNHMGSRMTEDARAMETVLSTVYDRGLFYMDSLVTWNTAVRDLSARRGLPVMERDVFLDNIREHGAILREFRRLKLAAIKKGYAIGIGHDEPVTLEVLARIMPEWRKEGIRFVKLSELAERLKETRG